MIMEKRKSIIYDNPKFVIGKTFDIHFSTEQSTMIKNRLFGETLKKCNAEKTGSKNEMKGKTHTE